VHQPPGPEGNSEFDESIDDVENSDEETLYEDDEDDLEEPVVRSRAAVVGLVSFMTLFVAGGLVSGWIFLVTVASFFSEDTPTSQRPSFQIPPNPIAPIVRSVPTPDVGGNSAPLPTETPVVDPLPVWEGSERVTILLLGVDQREDQRERNDPTRSDTMILATFDPATKTAGLLSIPRDLWVPIPGHGENKINTAHFFGDLAQKDGGPALAKRTVEYNFGVRVHHYARVDFRGFEQLIDTVGGITVDVDRPIKDDLYPNEDYGVVRIFIPMGLQRMDGRTALRFARSRHSDSDFGRNRRQQQVILAARDEALRLGMITRLPQLIGIIGSAISTDLSATDILALASAARTIKSEDISNRTVDSTMVIDSHGDGTVLLPNRAAIRSAVLEVFSDPGLRRESAEIEVLNGTTQIGLATRMANSLQSAGLTVTRVETAPRTDYLQTTIISRGGKTATVDWLARELRVQSANVRSESSSGSAPDITIIVGRDAQPRS
jgi:polyisoprenyl-teichoic acid--peptidoglycan teichoic acid transferase